MCLLSASEDLDTRSVCSPDKKTKNIVELGSNSGPISAVRNTCWRMSGWVLVTQSAYCRYGGGGQFGNCCVAPQLCKLKVNQLLACRRPTWRQEEDQGERLVILDSLEPESLTLLRRGDLSEDGRMFHWFRRRTSRFWHQGRQADSVSVLVQV